MPPPTSELWNPVHSLKAGDELPELSAYEDCTKAAAVVVVEALVLVLSAWGLPTANKERLDRAVMRELGQDTLNGLQRSIHDLHRVCVANETTLIQKVGALTVFVGESEVMPVLPRLVECIEQDWTVWQWIWTAAVVGLQVTAWMATDGVAFVAELLVVLSNVESLVEALIKAVEACRQL